MSEIGIERGPTALVILDGWGLRRDENANAVALAHTPVFDRHFGHAPSCTLRTDGSRVGLPEGQFGNSEVGHLNLGAGRIVMQDLPRIDRAIADGSLAASPVLGRLVERARAGSGRVHVTGLMSPGGVHSHQRHMVAVARALVEQGLSVVLHLFLDGRDTPPESAAGYLRDFEREIDGLSSCRIGTIGGRYYAMDRDRRWERTEKAFRAMVAGEGPSAATAARAVSDAYAAGTSDEFVEPVVIDGYAGVAEGDALFCVNFRADRVRQILRALLLPDFDGFERPSLMRWSAVVGMTRYATDLDPHIDTVFAPQTMERLLGEVVAAQGLRQLRAAETEKYPHVTFFFNGGREEPSPGEERLLAPSPKVATYDLAPEMSANELADRVIAEIGSEDHAFILVNFANPDMVGHTGVLAAAIRAVETVDACLGRLLDAIVAKGGRALVTADHGNCEQMLDPATGGPHTAHTLNPVPCFLVGAADGTKLRDGILADVAPTILELMGVDQPAEMTGKSLVLAA